jgi:hypothetical protein
MIAGGIGLVATAGTSGITGGISDFTSSVLDGNNLTKSMGSGISGIVNGSIGGILSTICPGEGDVVNLLNKPKNDETKNTFGKGYTYLYNDINERLKKAAENEKNNSKMTRQYGGKI